MAALYCCNFTILLKYLRHVYRRQIFRLLYRLPYRWYVYYIHTHFITSRHMSSSTSYNKDSNNNTKGEINSPESTYHDKDKKDKTAAVSVAIERVLKSFQFPTNKD